jgi:hypothetical protein
MARIAKIKCDKCASEVEARNVPLPNGWSLFVITDYRGGAHPDKTTQHELCEKCTEMVKMYIKDGGMR